MLTLRALNPATELHLFHEAYHWRPRYKPHLQVGRMSFETFSSNDPSQVVLGLFNPDLCAVYFFSEVSPNVFEAHFTSKRRTPVQDVFAGAKKSLDWFLDHGATVTARILERNRPIREFVEALGFERIKITPCALPCQSDTLSPRIAVSEYAARKCPSSD